METAKIIGDKALFAIEYTFLDNTRETELSLYVSGSNLLSFERSGQQLTTRWNLDELVLWLRGFLNNMQEDPYPVEAAGEYAAEKDINARDFDSDDDEAFDAYYDTIDAWNSRHRWHPACAGAILADLYFRQVGKTVEISWNNRDAEEGVVFSSILGGTSVPKEIFVSVTDQFLKDYADHWYSSL